MTVLALLACLFVCALGAFCLASPPRLVRALHHVERPTGLAVLAGIRVFLGTTFLLTASASSMPELINLVGVVLILRGLLLVLMGTDGVRRLLDWLSPLDPRLIRGAGVVLLVAGLGLGYSFVH